MVINYKKLNQFTKTDNYFLPNKEVLINLVKIGNSSFGKLKWKKQVLNIQALIHLKDFMNGLYAVWTEKCSKDFSTKNGRCF